MKRSRTAFHTEFTETHRLQRSAPSASLRETRRSGFTLIEVLVVMVIIAILAALTIGATKYAWAKAANSRAQAEIAAMETRLESYKNDSGIYPPSTASRLGSAMNNSGELYKALAGGSKKYFNFTPNQIGNSGTFLYVQDPFGKPYNYYCQPGNPAQTNTATFDIWSYGADGQNDTSDDITNWRR